MKKLPPFIRTPSGRTFYLTDQIKYSRHDAMIVYDYLMDYYKADGVNLFNMATCREVKDKCRGTFGIAKAVAYLLFDGSLLPVGNAKTLEHMRFKLNLD